MRYNMLTAVTIGISLFALSCLSTANTGWADEAYSREIVLPETLNLSWEAEWLTESFKAPKGACHPDSVRMEGADGPVPAQFIEIERWPGTAYVKRAKLGYVTDLDPLEKRKFTVHFGPDPRPAASSDLNVQRSENEIDLTNDAFGIRLFRGSERYDTAMDSDEVPGPVRGVRLADKTWTGGSRIYGPGKIRAVQSRLVEDGPALARVEMRYEYDDGRVMTLTCQLAARAPRAEWDMLVEPYDPEKAVQFVKGSGWAAAAEKAAQTAVRDGWQWRLDKGFEDIALSVQMNPDEARNRWGKPKKGPRSEGGRYNYHGLDLTPHVVNLAQEPAGKLALWMPWAAFHQTRQSVLTFTRTQDQEGRSEELQFAVLTPGEWVEAAEPGTWASYMNVRTRHKSVPLMRGENGSVFLQFNAASGYRHWQVGIPDHLVPEDRWKEGYKLHGVARRIGTKHATWSLNKVKDLVHDWQNPGPFEPLKPEPVDEVEPAALTRHLQRGRGWRFSGLSYHDRDAIKAYRMSGRDPEVAESLRLVERLGYFLSLVGNMDRWRYGTREILPELYHEVMRSDLVDRKQRRLFRAQMAHLGYIMDDPGDWSPERGWASGNLNMTIYNVKTSAHIASRIPNHPRAPRWGKPAAVWVDRLLDDHVGPKGEFLGSGESLTHYSWGTAGAMLSNAKLARQAGGRDLVTDPRMKKMVSFFAKIVTPPDPRPHKFRKVPASVTPPVGRGTVYNVPGLFDTMAREIADTDPVLAGDLWWSWKRAHPSEKAGMPYRTPDWTSELFPKTGVILRHGLDTAREHYAFFVLENSRVAYASEQGAFAAIWANGVPIATRFGGHGYEEREEILISRVLPAWNPGDRDQRFSRFLHEGPREISRTSFLPRQDYLKADLSMMRAKSIHHGGVENIPDWPVVEEDAELPVHWQRQVLFVKGPGATGPNYYVFRDTVSGEQPTRWQYWTISEKIGTPEDVANLHEFLSDRPGNEMRDARQIEGDRFTAVGQYGVDVEYYVASPQNTPRHTLRWGVEHGHYTQYQDMLHLQMPGNGSYFVAMFPRMREDSPPAFTTLGNGNVIRVKGDFGKDIVFLSEKETDVEVGDVRFRGTAGSVQDRREGGKVLSLSAPGEIEVSDGTLLASDGAVSLVVDHIMTVTVPDESVAERQVTLRGPGELSLVNPAEGVELEQRNGVTELTLPAGVRMALLMDR